MKPVKKVFSWLKATIGLSFGVIARHEFISVETVQHLKKLVRSPVVKAGVSLFPGGFVPKVLAFLDTKGLPILLEVLVIHGIIRENEKQSIAVEKILARLKQLNPTVEGNVYADYAGRLNYRLADGVLTAQEAWDQAQDTFFTFYKKQ